MSTVRRFATDLLATLALVAFGLGLPASRQLVSGCVTSAAPSPPPCEARLAKVQLEGVTAQGAHRFCDGETLVTVEAGSVVSLEIPRAFAQR